MEENRKCRKTFTKFGSIYKERDVRINTSK